MKVKTKILSSIVLGSAILVSGCGFNNSSYYTPPVNYTMVQMHSDAKILGAVMAIDKGEIAAASLAQRKSTNQAILDYAAYLNSQHSQNLAEVQAVSQRINVVPVKGEVARMLEHKGKRMMSHLHHLNNGAFDRAYIADMVKGHKEALYVLNTKLIPSAINPLVRRQLEDTRNHVSMHLQKAMAIQSQLGR
ncbi:MAG: DUF4142 domain-containing protein [Tatlockia sp.]|nr:DUF4142 domain-containing protein [Tatlockia sp.]